MIKEALAYIAQLGYDQQKPGRLDIPDPRAARFIVGKDVLEVPLPKPPRAHQVKCLDDLVSLAGGTEGGQTPTVFVNENTTILTLDDEGHRVERVTFAHEFSDLWQTVKTMHGWKNQKEFIRLLKIDLAGCLPENALLDMVRKVTFTDSGVTVREIQKTKESLGKSIKAEIDCTKDIPDYVRLQLPVYKSLGERETYLLTCSVEIDPTRVDAFRLAPVPDEIEKIQQAAVQLILERLKASLPEGVPCYYGSP